MQKSLAQIKATEGRDITSQVDNNTLVYGETGSGTGGAFNFMMPVNNALANYQPKFNYVSSQEIQLDNNASYIICSHHPYDSNYNFYGLVLNYNDVITEFIISNSNTDLPYTKNGTKLNFKGGFWLTRIQKIASSINN